jgi:hypothetical protein
VARNVTDAPGSARLTAAVSCAPFSPGPPTSRRFGSNEPGLPRCGTTTASSPATPGTPPMRPASLTVTVLLPTVRAAGAVPTTWAAAAVATAGTVPPFPDSAATGNRVPGAWSTTAAYWAGSTNTTGNSNPLGVVASSTSAPAVETTPGIE